MVRFGIKDLVEANGYSGEIIRKAVRTIYHS